MASDTRGSAFPSPGRPLLWSCALLLSGACDNGNTPATSTSPTREIVGRVAVVASARSLAVGDNITLTATVTSLEGVRLTDRPVMWTMSQPALATITRAGLTATISARSTGELHVTAATEGMSATVILSILPASAAISDSQTVVRAETPAALH